MLNLKKIAITGNVAAGKTTACKLLKEFGAYIVNADEIVHKLLSDNTRLIDKIINLNDVSWELYEEINMFEPYGIDNNKPLFQINNIKVKKLNFLGRDKKHIKIEIDNNDSSEIEIIGFNFGKYSNNIKEGGIINIVAEINLNEWNGNKKLQLIIRDIKIKNNG